MIDTRLAVLLCLIALPACPALAQQRTAPHAAPAPAPAPAPAVPAATPGPAGPTPERTTATYGDWTVRCEAQAGPGGVPARACEASHAVLDARGQPVAQVVVGRSPVDGGVLAVVQLPVNAMVAEPVRLRAAAAAAPLLTLPFRVCGPRGCFAQAQLAAPELGRLRQRVEPMQIEYRDGGAAAVVLPVGLRGFASALDALNLDAR